MATTSVRSLLAGLLCSALAAACAGTPEDPASRRCVPDTAFERGLVDGKAGRPVELAWIPGCGQALAPVLERAYRDGHAVGVEERAGGEPGGAGSGPRSGRAFRCEVHARGDTFVGYGPGPIEADAAARAACREKNADLYCQEVSCRRSE